MLSLLLILWNWVLESLATHCFKNAAIAYSVTQNNYNYCTLCVAIKLIYSHPASQALKSKMKWSICYKLAILSKNNLKRPVPYLCHSQLIVYENSFEIHNHQCKFLKKKTPKTNFSKRRIFMPRNTILTEICLSVTVNCQLMFF